MNKEAELFYLEKFKANFPGFPIGDICPDERPDFLIKATTGTVGIEITYFYREMSSDTNTPLQQRESVRSKIITLAQTIYDRKGLPPIAVFVHFDLNFHCRRSAIQPIAERLVELAEQSLSAAPNEKVWRSYEIQLTGVMLMSVQKRRAKKSYW
jgi:hypothetical protein